MSPRRELANELRGKKGAIGIRVNHDRVAAGPRSPVVTAAPGPNAFESRAVGQMLSRARPRGNQAAIRFLQGQIGNRAVARLVEGSVGRRRTSRREDLTAQAVQRAPAAAAKKAKNAAAKDRDHAVAELQKRWKVGSVFEGSQSDQEKRMTTFGQNYFGSPAAPTGLSQMVTAAGWQAWSPPSGSPIWGWLVEAFERFDKVFGGVPNVKEIAFYETDYKFLPPDKGGPSLTADGDVGADFGGGSMAIYHTGETRAAVARLALERREPGAQGSVESLGTSGGFEFTVMHEMGHGLIESVAQVVDKDTIKRFGASVGWLKGSLYDGGLPAVQDAFSKGSTPAAKYQITPKNWSDAAWTEQPLSAYMASSLSEDFPETVAAYIAKPDALRGRSPLRFKFIDDNKQSFLPALQQDLTKQPAGNAPGTANAAQPEK